MNKKGPVFLGVLVFVLVLSVWNYTTSNLPGSVGGGAHWIVLLIAAIAGTGVYLQFLQN